MNKFDEFGLSLYRDRLKGMQIVLRDSPAGPGRTVQEETGGHFLQPRTSLLSDLGRDL